MITHTQQTLIVSMYVAGARQAAICQAAGCSQATVWRTLKRLNVPMPAPGTRRLYALDENAFALVTEESAYWAGFLMADGCVTRQGRSWHTTVSAAVKDKAHIEAFRDFLGSTQPVMVIPGRKKNHSPMAILNVCSTRLAADLGRFGIVPRKSKTARVVGLAANRDFWRGAVDGDGCIIIQRRESGESPFLGLVGSKRLTAQFAAFVRASTGYPARNRATGTIFEVRLNCSFAEEMLHILYDGAAIALPRKAVAAAAVFARAERIAADRERRRTQTCATPGCGRRVVAWGHCDTCYRRERKRQAACRP